VPSLFVIPVAICTGGVPIAMLTIELGTLVPLTVTKLPQPTDTEVITGISIVTMTGSEGVLVQPNIVATAVIVCVPSDKGVVIIMKSPLLSVNPVVFGLPSTKRVIKALGLDVPVTVTLLQLVTIALVMIGCCAITTLNIETSLEPRLVTAKQLLVGEKANDRGRGALGVVIGIGKGLPGTEVRLQPITLNTETLLEF
jgi:hypothetical protein